MVNSLKWKPKVMCIVCPNDFRELEAYIIYSRIYASVQSARNSLLYQSSLCFNSFKSYSLVKHLKRDGKRRKWDKVINDITLPNFLCIVSMIQIWFLSCLNNGYNYLWNFIIITFSNLDKKKKKKKTSCIFFLSLNCIGLKWFEIRK